MREPRIVVVEWVDSTSLECGGWMDVEDVAANLELDALRYETVGYLVGSSRHAIAVAGSRNASEDDDRHRNTKLSDVIVIPRRSVLKLTRFEGRAGGQNRSAPDRKEHEMGETQSEPQPGDEPQPDGDDEPADGDDDGGKG